MKEDKITFESEYKGYSINSGRDNLISCMSGCYIKTLEQVIEMVQSETKHHSKSLFVRLDITNPLAHDKLLDRKDMTRIMENTKRRLEKKYQDSANKVDMNYVWTTENEGSNKNKHFHAMIAVNGNAIQNGYAISTEMNDVVKKYLDIDNDGLVEFSNSNGKYGKMVNRNSDDFEKQKDDVVYAGSYLAKVRTKENKPKGARVSSASRVRKD